MKPPFAKAPPMTRAEMQQRWQAGDPLAAIAGAARRRNGLSRADVRAIVFGDQP